MALWIWSSGRKGQAWAYWRQMAFFSGLFCLLLAGLSGCDQRDEELQGGEMQHYEVRGELIRLPVGDRPMQIRHEAIPNFRNMQGEVVGMDAMTMPFPVAPGVSLDGLAVGDRVRFDFEVRWGGRPPYQIVRIEKLPEGTVLEGEVALPPKGAGHTVP